MFKYFTHQPREFVLTIINDIDENKNNTWSLKRDRESQSYFDSENLEVYTDCIVSLAGYPDLRLNYKESKLVMKMKKTYRERIQKATEEHIKHLAKGMKT